MARDVRRTTQGKNGSKALRLNGKKGRLMSIYTFNLNLNLPCAFKPLQFLQIL
jgi:hypothetical protein